MPRYYFDIRNNGEFFRDRVGVEMPDVKAAYQEAVLSLSEIAYEANPLEEAIEVAIWVADHQRQPLFDLRITVDPALAAPELMPMAN